MRKSFRLQALSERNRHTRNFRVENCSDELDEDNDDNNNNKVSLMSQIGSNASKLLRSVYSARNQRSSSRHSNGTDAIQATDGSFKVLSSMLHYGTTTLNVADSQETKQKLSLSQLDEATCKTTTTTMMTTSPVRKSDAEMKIELRLQRAKRRVLPSSNYKTTNSQEACEGLNLNELEEIKRDNLRLTLLRSQAMARKMTIKANDEQVARSEWENEQIKSNEEQQLIGCSCKSIENYDTDDEMNHNNDCRHLDFCSCHSISSSFSSINSQLELRDDELQEKEESKQDDTCRLVPLRRTTSQPELLLTTNHITSLFSKTNESRARDGFVVNVGDIEHPEVEGDKTLNAQEAFNVNGAKKRNTFDDNDNESCQSGNKTFIELERLCGELTKSSRFTGSTELARSTEINGSSQVSVLNDDEYYERHNDGHLQDENEPAVGGGKKSEDGEEGERQVNCNSEFERSLGGVCFAQIASEQVRSSGDANGGSECTFDDQQQFSSDDEDDDDGHSCRIQNSQVVSDPQTSQNDQFTCCSFVNKSAISQPIKNSGTNKQQINESIETFESECQRDFTNDEYQATELAKEDIYECKRRERQQRRRREIMLSLSSGGSDNINVNYWNEIMERPTGRVRSMTTLGIETNFSGQQERPVDADEHLYSTIYGANESRSSPLRCFEGRDQEYQFAPVSDWAQQFNREENDRKLFEQQLDHLNSLKQQKQEYNGKKNDKKRTNSTMTVNKTSNGGTKKSLLGRLKQLMNASKNIKQPPTGEKGAWRGSVSPTPVSRTDKNLETNILKQEDQLARSRRWQKSRTLTSRSTQNLLGSSIRYLSTSRKSINLLGANNNARNECNYEGRSCNETPGNEGESGRFFASKSFMSGFLTLGRRSRHNQHDGHGRTGRHEFVGKIFKQNGRLDNNEAGRHHHQSSLFISRRSGEFGSADSLPSADSGLSCGHLQTSSSSDENYSNSRQLIKSNGNIYTTTTSDTTFSEDSRPRQGDDDLLGNNGTTLPSASGVRHQVVGYARARVDCNPCAYDKEALVFKSGDIIEILEKHKSGTWIGQCNNQIGHFKFINVVELSDDSGCSGPQVCSDTNQPVTIETDQGVFITKLEIKSPTNQSSVPKSSPINRRSISMNTINNDSADNSNGLNNLAQTKETIMSSLEQLLFAIGLADEFISGCDGRGANTDQNSGTIQPPDANLSPPCSTSSYLEILNKGGINNLQSFSAIDRCQELERIGIIDDEHQRRLLMAAKIIRQASQAAKKDFDENYQSKANHREVENNGKHKRHGAKSIPNTPQLATKATASQSRTVRPNSSNFMAGQEVALNDVPNCEPIYVNLVDPPEGGSDASCEANDDIKSNKLSVNAFNRGHSIRISNRNFKRFNGTTANINNNNRRLNDLRRISNGSKDQYKPIQQHQEQQPQRNLLASSSCTLTSPPGVWNKKVTRVGYKPQMIRTVLPPEISYGSGLMTHTNWPVRHLQGPLPPMNMQHPPVNHSRKYSNLNNKSHHLINSKSAYDLRLNLSHFFS